MMRRSCSDASCAKNFSKRARWLDFSRRTACRMTLRFTRDESRHLLTTFHTLRQQLVKGNQEPSYAVADFVAPRESGRMDYLGLFAVTAGLRLEPLVAKFEKDNDDYNALMAKALADRLAEGLAELTHKRARDEWGFGKNRKSESE